MGSEEEPAQECYLCRNCKREFHEGLQDNICADCNQNKFEGIVLNSISTSEDLIHEEEPSSGRGGLTGDEPNLILVSVEDVFRMLPSDVGWQTREESGLRIPPFDDDPVGRFELFNITKSHEESAARCSICLKEFHEEQTARLLPCEHFFHDSCLASWLELNDFCPTCRVPIDDNASSLELDDCFEGLGLAVSFTSSDSSSVSSVSSISLGWRSDDARSSLTDSSHT